MDKFNKKTKKEVKIISYSDGDLGSERKMNRDVEKDGGSDARRGGPWRFKTSRRSKVT